ncbi:hypothetical protein [Edaphobacter aggregans]|uniref:hypothetical protein n=1 Tax=Edaphobacter aggregans TaxID=570835 RepID=UPI00054E7BE2|nr:hypothetical protein [Edaphobacter aggregans]
MQVLLKPSTERKDIQCTVCQQGFRLYWERSEFAERETMRAIVLADLRRHHASDPTPAAHPAGLFNLPDWGGEPQFSGAALLGGHSAVRPAFSPTRRQAR